LPNGCPIWQDADYFKFTLDAVLLAAFAPAGDRPRIIELGAGTGAVSLLLAARCRAEITGLDNNERMIELFTRSIADNGLTGRVRAVPGDVKVVRQLFKAESFDLVVANPPYRKLGQGRSRKGGAASACHEEEGALADFAGAARWLLRYGGGFALSHLPERLPEVLSVCQALGLEPKRLQLVHSYQHKPPATFLLEARYGGRPGLKIMEPFFVYKAGMEYSEQLLAADARFQACPRE
jgi:tRNA1(Val) A37 N6-methylase TrmN6